MSTRSKLIVEQRLQRSVLLHRLSLSRSTAPTVPATSCRLTMTAKADCTPASLPYSKI
jgi:hypothetical protein